MELNGGRLDASERAVTGSHFQSHPASNIARPVEVRKVYSKDEQAEIQGRLDKRLGPEYITRRKDKVNYLAIDHAIELANYAFGFNGWSSSANVNTGWVEEGSQKNKWNANAFATVRVTLADGTYHEDEGWGESLNFPSKGGAIHKARKHAISDGLKRALRQFGSLTGNCLKDDDFVKKVSSIRVPPRKYNLSELHRPGDLPVTTHQAPTLPPVPQHPSTTAKLSESRQLAKPEEPEDEFGGELDFDEVEITSLPAAVALPRPVVTGSEPTIRSNTAHSSKTLTSEDVTANKSSMEAELSKFVGFTAAPRPMQPDQPGRPFNPNASGAQSIRKTEGIDHSRSGRVMRDEVAILKSGQSNPATGVGTAQSAEYGPRQIGRPPIASNMASPGQNRGQFKMPRPAIPGIKPAQGLKREGDENYDGQTKRQALAARPQ